MPDNLLAPDRLNDKLGKLPIWAWGLIGGTAVLGAYYFVSARKKARVQDAGVNPAPGDQTLGSVFLGMANPEDTVTAALPVAGYTGGALSTSENALGSETLETNLTWLNRGIKISGSGFLVSTTALQKYLGGKPLTDTEQNIVSKVLQQIGYPPEGAPLLVKAVKDATPTPAKDKTPTKGTTDITPTPTVTPTVTPKPAPAAKVGANGYPLDSQGREVIEVSKTFPKKILSGKFAGKMRPLNWDAKKVVYVEVDKPTIPASPTR